jgi:hypothetical protein
MTRPEVPLRSLAMALAALLIAGAAAAATIAAAVVAVLAHRRAGEAKSAAQRSAAAAERSARAAEEAAAIAREDLDLRRGQLAAALELRMGNVRGAPLETTASFEIWNNGGSPAREVAPGELLVNDQYFRCNGVAAMIAPGKHAEFRGEGPPGGLAGQLDRALAESVAYIDDLGPHTVSLSWRRGTKPG